MLIWCAVVVPAYAFPIDGFTAPVSISCEDQSMCSGTVRSSSAVGRYTGITVAKGDGGKAVVEIGARGVARLHFESRDTSTVSLNFSWDGDPHPQQLSGAGLNCLDLTRQGAYAFVLSGVRIHGSCSEDAVNAACPEVLIESRVYDARDPTGQRFSSSTIHRTVQQRANLTVPFSNFTTAGPRGKADFSCVGAVTITARFEGFSSGEMDFGPIFTNGSEGLTPLPTPTPAPTDTPQPVTPTPEAAVSLVPTQEPVVSVERVVGGGDDLIANDRKAAQVWTQTPMAVQEISPAPSRIPSVRESRPLTEEITYGEVVSGAE